MDVIPDSEFAEFAGAGAGMDRNVVLYGNAETNAAWALLLPGGPVRVDRKGVTVGARRIEGSDLGCFFIRPRPGSSVASVGVVAGTGLEGMRAADGNRYFIAGSGYPDLMVFGSDMLERRFDGVRAAGYFGMDWSVENGEFAFRE